MSKRTFKLFLFSLCYGNPIIEEVNECVAQLSSMTVPEHCTDFMMPRGGHILSQSEKMNSILKRCHRRVYFKHLKEVPGLFAEIQKPKTDDECSVFFDIYDSLDNEFTVPRSFKVDKVTVQFKAALAGAMLKLVQNLHNAGFSHGSISSGVFGVDKGYLCNKLSKMPNLRNLKLAQLLDIQYKYDENNHLNYEVLIQMKQDLIDFADNIIYDFFPLTNLYSSFLADIERINIGEFIYEDWVSILSEISKTGRTDVLLTTDGITLIGPEILPTAPGARFISEWEKLELVCSRESHCARPAQRSSTFVVEELGTLKRIDDTRFAVVKSIGHYVGKAEFDEDSCNVQSLLMLLNGLHRSCPKIYQILPKTCNAGFVIDLFEPSLTPKNLMGSPAELYRAMRNAIVALELLHGRGIVFNMMDSFESFKILSDGTFKFIDFSMVEPYIDSATGAHIPRVHSGSRKNDMVKLALMVARALNFQDNLVNGFYMDMDALGWYDGPAYSKWARLFGTAYHINESQNEPPVRSHTVDQSVSKRPRIEKPTNENMDPVRANIPPADMV
jgi:hypothetical protein